MTDTVDRSQTKHLCDTTVVLQGLISFEELVIVLLNLLLILCSHFRTGWETFGNEQIWYLPLKWMYLHGEAWIKVAIHMHLNPWQSSFVTTALHQIIAFLHLQRSDTWVLPAFITLCSITGEDARTPLSLKMKQQNIPHGVFSFLLLESINIFFWQWNTPLDKLVSEAHNNWWIKPSRVS